MAVRALMPGKQVADSSVVEQRLQGECSLVDGSSLVPLCASSAAEDDPGHVERDLIGAR